MERKIEIISREQHAHQVIEPDASIHLDITESSVVYLPGNHADIMSYSRMGDDLVIQMKGGGIIRCARFFEEDEKGNHSELVFGESEDDSRPVVHVIFQDLVSAGQSDAVELLGNVELLSSIDPLLYSDDDGGILAPLLGAGMAAALLGGVVAADESHDHGKRDRENHHDDREGPSIVIHPVTGDDVIVREDISGGVTIEGSSSEPTGCKVVITVNSSEFSTTTDRNGNWSVEVPTDTWNGIEGDIIVVAVVTDESGNTAQDDRTVKVNTDIDEVHVFINPVTGDDVVNVSEAVAGVTLEGTSSAQGAGCEVVVRIGGEEFKTQTDENGNWSVDVPAQVWNGLDGETDIVVVMTNETGNTAEAERTIIVETSGPHIIVNPITGDDIIDTDEAMGGVIIDGSTTPDAEVVVVVDGKEFPTTADGGGKWAVEVPEDVLDDAAGIDSIIVEVTEADGDTATIDHPVTIVTGDIAISVNPVTGDDVINATEAADSVSVDGTSSESSGCEVVVRIGRVELKTLTDEGGNWSVEVPAEVWNGIDSETDIVAIVTNESGNTAETERKVTVETSTPTVTIAPVAGDDLINAAEH
ncbi:BapA/Bap/LapF family prefix-like domain-containing protein, partial [Halomonas cupida]